MGSLLNMRHEGIHASDAGDHGDIDRIIALARIAFHEMKAYIVRIKQPNLVTSAVRALRWKP
jgi:hypothetical protein